MLLLATTATLLLLVWCPPAVRGQGCIANASSLCTDCEQLCRVANPTYGQQCDSINIVMIVDESGSVSPARDAVRAALKDFNNGLLAVSENGTTVKLGIISFNSLNSLDFPLSEINASYINTVNAWVDGADSPLGTPGYYVGVGQNGWTNWRNPLKLAAETWPNQGDVDVYVWFTDGRPETGNGVASPGCDDYCYTPGMTYFSNLCTAPDTCLSAPPGLLLNDQGSNDPYGQNERPRNTWGATKWADAVKRTGAKLFMVGVGGILESEDVAQLVTGPKRWNGDPDTFGTSDYLIGEDLFQLGTNLTAVLKGLCPNGPNVGAIVGGVIAAAVVAALVAAALIAFFTWKGVAYYQATHGLSGAGAQSNPAYVEMSGQGEMPDF